MKSWPQTLRGVLRSPAFLLVAVASLAVGVGASAVIFSVVDAVLLRPLPYPDAGRVVRVWNHWSGSPKASVSPAEYYDYRDHLHVFEAFGVYTVDSSSLTGGGEPERVRTAYVSSGLLPALGARPAAGRTFTEGEELPGNAVAMMSEGLWRRRFGGARDILGRRITVDGEARTVVGVLPAGFEMPEDFAAGEATEVYLPLGLDRSMVPNRGSHFLGAVGRLAPGVSVERARMAVGAEAAKWAVDYPDAYPAEMRIGATVLPIADDLLGPARPVLLVLFGAAAVVLLIACANVTNLMLARLEGRQKEMAMRAALGAGRARLVRQLVEESVQVALLGGVGAALLAFWVGRGLVALRPADLPRVGDVRVDAWTLAFVVAASVLAGLVCAAIPAAQLARSDLQSSLREAGRGSTSGVRRRARRALIVAEITVAVVLLAGAGLMTRSFLKLMRVDPGFRPEHVLTTEITLPSASYAQDARIRAFYRQLAGRLAAVPGVTAAGAVSNLPLATKLGDLNFRIEGRPVPEGEVSPRADWQVVTPEYFRAMGMRLVKGRAILDRDDEHAPGVVVISESLARTYWPDSNPIGTRFLLGGGAGPGWVTVVGIVADVRHDALDVAPNPQMYLPHAQFHFWSDGPAVASMDVTVRTAADRTAVAGAVRAEVRALDPELPVGAFRTMEQVVSASVSRPRVTLALLLAFSAVALLLSAIGVFAVLAYMVGRRTKEIGVRMALGARGGAVAAMVVREGMALVAAGLALGVALALGLTRLLASQLYEVQPRDPITLTAVVIVLGGVALIACWVPALRATRVDPLTALRIE